VGCTHPIKLSVGGYGVQVVRTALLDAASVSGLMTTTECIIVDQPEKNPMPAMPKGYGGEY
jgi:chaperonin GroEL